MTSSSTADDEVDYTEEVLMAKTKTELLDLAAELGVEGVSSSNTKAQITAAILDKTQS
jgi:hypothetical protein